VEYLTTDDVFKAREQTVRRTRSQLEALFQNMVEGIVIKNSLGQVVRVNPAALRILRRQEADLLGHDIIAPTWRVIREDGTHFPREEFPSILAQKTGKPHSTKAMGVFLPCGELIWLSVNATPIQVNDFNIPEEIVVTIQDITAEKISDIQNRILQEALRKAVREFRHLFDKSPMGVIQLDRERRHLRSNRAYQEMLGYTEDELKSLSLFDITFADDVEACRELSIQLIQGTSIYRSLKRMVRKDGTIIWVRFSSAALQPGDPDNTAISIVEDVTEEQNRKEHLERLETIINSTSDMIGWTTLSGESEFLNEAFKKALGPVSAKNVDLLQPYPEKARKLMREAVLPTAISKGIWSGETEILDYEKGELPVSQVVLCHKDSKGSPTGFSAIIRDISNMKRTEATLIESSKMSALGEMSAGIAHEINNPLSIIIGKVIQLQNSLKEQDRTPDEMISILDRIEKTALRISKVITGLRTFARDADNDPFVPTRLRSVIEQTLSLCEMKYRSLGVDVRVGEIPHSNCSSSLTSAEQRLRRHT
jgi:PAS domain S-box-containing protein